MFATVALTLLCAAVTANLFVSKFEGNLGQLMFTTLSQQQGALIGATSMTIDGTGDINWANSAAFRRSAATTSHHISFDSCVGLNTMGEVLVVLAAHRLHEALQSQFATSLDDNISTAYSPRNVFLRNPTNGASISYKDLMRHTSTIVDINWAGSTSTVGEFNAFLESYFVSGTSLVPTVFTPNRRPGVSTSYNFARANVALLAYILGRVIAVNGLPYSNLQDYIAQTILNPLGMANTFFLNQDGTAPGLVTQPSFSGTFSSIPYGLSSSYASFYQGCIADQLGGLPLLHPAFWADYMGYTTAGDVTLLLHGMFYQPTFATAVAKMRETMLITSGRYPGQTRQGLGLVYLDGSAICAAGINTQVINACPVSNTSSIIGYITNRDHVDRGFFCANVTSASGMLCTSVTLVYSQAAQRSSSSIFALAAAAWQDAVGTPSINAALLTSLSTNAPVSINNGVTTADEWFGVYAFIGVYLTVLGAYFGTLFIQWLLMPAALATVTETGSIKQLGFGGGAAAPREPSILAQ